MSHTTVEPDGVSVDVLAERLARDLRDRTQVSDVHVTTVGRGAVVKFTPAAYNLQPATMRVLAEHGATLGRLCLEEDASLQTAWAHVHE